MIISLGYYGAEERPAKWDLSEHPHGLVCGQTGSGKTYLLRLIIEQASQTADVWLADGKDSRDFDGLDLDRIAMGPHESVELIEATGAEIVNRNRSAADNRPLLIVVDEAAAITLRIAGDSTKDARERRDRLLASLGQIALMGRSVRVHLLVALQRPDADVLGGAMGDQFGLRIALGWLSPDGYRMMFQRPRLAAPAPPQGRGWGTGLIGNLATPVALVVEVSSGI